MLWSSAVCLGLACATGGGGGGGGGNGAGNGDTTGNSNTGENPGDENGNGSSDGGLEECEPGQGNPEATIRYSEDIVPLLERSGCLSSACHGEPPSSNYLLIDYEAMFQRGEQAVAFEACPIVPGDPEASYLMEKLSESPRFGERMPNNRPPLADEELGLIRTWIEEGAPNN